MGFQAFSSIKRRNYKWTSLRIQGLWRGEIRGRMYTRWKGERGRGLFPSKTTLNCGLFTVGPHSCVCTRRSFYYYIFGAFHLSKRHHIAPNTHQKARMLDFGGHQPINSFPQPNFSWHLFVNPEFALRLIMSFGLTP